MLRLERNHETRNGHTLYTWQAAPEGPPRACMMLIHGVAEHSGRYLHAARYFNQRGYTVWAFDGPGHGRSAEGKPRAFVSSLNAYAEDAFELYTIMRASTAGVPSFLLGHSMGALVLADLLIRQSTDLCGAIFSGLPLIPSRRPGRWLTRLTRELGRGLPHLPLVRLDSQLISRDPEVVRAYDSDPLVCRGHLPARTAGEILRTAQAVKQRMHRIQTPSLILHGSRDRIAEVDGSQLFFRALAATDKTLRVFEGLQHEILNEPEQRQVMQVIADWMDRRL